MFFRNITNLVSFKITNLVVPKLALLHELIISSTKVPLTDINYDLWVEFDQYLK